MNRCGTLFLRIVAMMFVALLPLEAMCQSISPPPKLVTIPSPVPVNQAFDADVYFLTTAAPLAFYNDDVVIVGSTITAYFDSGCGFICPGGQAYGPFRLHLPALQQGRYTLRIIDGTFHTHVYAEFSLAVGVPAVDPVPARDPRALVFLIVLFLLFTCMVLRRSTSPSTSSTLDS